MSLLAVLLILVMAAAILSSIACMNKAKTTQALLSKEQSERATLEEKFSSIKKEYSSMKEDLSKKSKLLEEARDLSKRRLRKEGIKANSEADSNTDSVVDPEIERLRSALEAMKSQLSSMQAQNNLETNRARVESKAEFEQELSLHKEEISKLNEQLGRRKQEADKQKRTLKQSLPAIDIDSLSEDTAKEIVRLLRKSENYEKMYAASQGKLQLSIERFTEIQKRYFAVCRELALAVGGEPNANEEQSRNIAEDIVAASDMPIFATTEEILEEKISPQSTTI
jgi:DNA repair exonuclease SbcCD ATPase subunit